MNRKTILLASAALTLLATAPAAALDFTRSLQAPDGKIIVDDLLPEKPTLTLGTAAYHALLFVYPDEQALTGEEKFQRAQIAVKVRATGDVTLTAEETATVKKVLAKLYGPSIVYATWQLLDPATKPPAAK